MLSFQEFFAACTGVWTTERTYHFPQQAEIERSYTEFRVSTLTTAEKQQILTPTAGSFQVTAASKPEDACPGFAIAFETVSDKDERVAMSLKALFVPDGYLTLSDEIADLPLPIAAQVPPDPLGEVMRGYYLRDQGYSEAGAIAGRFTYQPTRRALEMTTHYQRSVAVDQIRFLSPDTRLRTIVTYERPKDREVPSVITLVGFGLERKN
jgi:CpeS-like protein